jgi:ribosomal protein L11 methylase PrmA
VSRLEWQPAESEWSHYAERRESYDEAGEEAKTRFVGEILALRSWASIWDLGSNTGRYSRMAADHASHVVAMDGDHLAVERLYRGLRAEERHNVLPLVMNLADPSPSRGWRGCERQALADREAPELILALALIHHLVISANVRVPDLVAWLAELTPNLVVEHVDRSDPMVQRLLLDKRDNYDDYHRSAFEGCLRERFEIRRREVSPSGTRVLYFATRRGSL